MKKILFATYILVLLSSGVSCHPLLSDTDNKVLKAFGVPNSSLRGSKHAEEALAYLKKNPKS